jgi:membrane protein required for colicin V production
MNVLDIIILIVLAWGAFRGFTQGFILQIVTFIALIIGIWASIAFSDPMSEFLTKNMDITGKYLPVLSFILIFVLVIVVAHLIGMLLTRFVEIASLGWLNRLGGIAFGVLKMAFIVSVLLTVQNRMKEKIHIISEKQIQNSLLYKPVASLAPAIFPHLRQLALDKRFEEIIDEK